MLINNNPNLMANGGTIQAPIISKEDFVKLFMQHVDDCNPISDKATFEHSMLTNIGTIGLTGDVFEYMEEANYIALDFDYIYALPDEITTGAFNMIVGLRTTSKGIPFLGYITASDCGLDVFRMVFFDGNQFRIYTPYYGNCWNIDETWQIGYEGGDEDEDADYCAKYGTTLTAVENAPVFQLIDEASILQEIEQVFTAGVTITNPTLSVKSSQKTNSSNTTNSSSNSQSASSKQRSTMEILYEVFSKKNFQMIPSLQQALIAQGAKTYDKTKCFQDLRNKDIFQSDIYNFILQFNNNDSVANKIIECTKISMYIKRFQYYHEGLIL